MGLTELISRCQLGCVLYGGCKGDSASLTQLPEVVTFLGLWPPSGSHIVLPATQDIHKLQHVAVCRVRTDV